MRKEHRWNDRTEDGEKREVLAQRPREDWQILTKLKGESYWNRCDPMSVELLEALLDTLERKYQRKRAPYVDVLAIRKLLEDARAREAAQAAEISEAGDTSQAGKSEEE